MASLDPPLSPSQRLDLQLYFLDSTDQILLSVDPLGHIVYWNQGAQKVWGWSESEVQGQILGDVLKAPDLTQNLLSHSAQWSPEKGWSGEFAVVRRDGVPLVVQFDFSVVLQEKRPVICLVGHSPHATEHSQLQEANRLLAEAGELLLDTLDYEEPLKTLVHLAVPQVADWCAVHLLKTDGTIEQVALAPVEVNKIPAAEYWLQKSLPVDEVDGLPAVFKTGKPKLVTTGDSHAMAAATIQSYMIVPLRAQPQTIGAVTFVTAESGRRLNVGNLAVAENLASHISVYMDKARLFRKSQELNVELEHRVDARTFELRAAINRLKLSETTLQTLFRFSNNLNSTLDIRMIVDELAEEAVRIVGGESGFAGLCTREGMTSHRYFRDGVGVPFEHVWVSGQGVPGWTLKYKVPYVTADAGADSRVEHQLPFYAEVRSMICIPILNSLGVVLGFFSIQNKRGEEGFTAEDQSILLALAPVASIAIQNALAFQQRLSDLVELNEASQQLQALAANLESAREQERTRIAGDLHDELGQALTAMKFDLAWLSERLVKNDLTLAAKAKAITEQMDLMIKTVRRISTELRPGMLDDLGLAASIEWLAKSFEKDKGIGCSVTVEGHLPWETAVPAPLALAVYRVFQEALTNIVRHSEARTVDVSLILGDQELVLQVHDDGRGISHHEIHGRKTLGLLGMKERVHRLGGTITFLGSAAEGTMVTVTFPLGKAHA